MVKRIDIEFSPANPEERRVLLDLMRTELADRMERTLSLMGLTSDAFESLYESRGEVRTIGYSGQVAGHCWIEHRNRELHLHAIFVLSGFRGRGIGTATLRKLEQEYAGAVDLIELGVEQSNPRARALYQRCGYHVVRSLPELGFDIMRRQLDGDFSG